MRMEVVDASVACVAEVDGGQAECALANGISGEATVSADGRSAHVTVPQLALTGGVRDLSRAWVLCCGREVARIERRAQNPD